MEIPRNTTLTPGHHPEQRRTLNIFVLAMLSLAVVISLRNLSVSAEYGLSSLFYYVAAALFFMIPYALVAAELASGWPKGGGIFIWVKEALGTRWGFFAMWLQWFHNMTFFPALLAFIAAALAQLINPELAHNRVYLATTIVISFWAITLLNFLGVKTSAIVSTICVIIGAILPGAVLIGLGIYWLGSGAPPAISLSAKDLLPDFTHFTNLVFLSGIFLALSGVEVNANLAREVKNPQKNFPKAIFIASFLTVLILILGSLSIAVVIPREKISLVSGLFDTFHAIFDRFNLGWLVPIISLFIVVGALGELNAWTIAGVKGLFVTTEYGCLPPLFHKINKEYTPVNMLIAQGLIITVIATLFIYLPNVNVAFWILSALSAQMHVVMYITLFISALVLRYKKPHIHRVYKIPGGNPGLWILSVIGTLACLFALFVSFFPPLKMHVGNIYEYEAILMGGILFSVLFPHILYSIRKPHWQYEVLSQIRLDIHSRTH